MKTSLSNTPNSVTARLVSFRSLYPQTQVFVFFTLSKEKRDIAGLGSRVIGHNSIHLLDVAGIQCCLDSRQCIMISAMIGVFQQ